MQKQTIQHKNRVKRYQSINIFAYWHINLLGLFNANFFPLEK